MKLLIVTLCLIYAVSAVPVPEDKPKSIELLKIPLKGDKVSCVQFVYPAYVLSHPSLNQFLEQPTRASGAAPSNRQCQTRFCRSGKINQIQHSSEQDGHGHPLCFSSVVL